MTANEMGNTFEVLYEAATLTNRQFNAREKSLFLNLGTKMFVDTRVFPDMNTKGKGFESDSKRILDLVPLLASTTDLYLRERGDFVQGTYLNGALRNNDKSVEGITSNQTTYGTVTDADDIKYGVLVELKDEILYIVSENCDLSSGDGNNKEWRYNVRVDNIPHAQYINTVYNDLKNPFKDLVWRREYGQSLPTSLVTAGRNTVDFRSSATPRTYFNITPIGTLVPIASGWYFDGTRKRIVQLIPGSEWKVEKYNIFYIKSPNTIVVDYNRPDKQVNCDLHPHVHQEIVELAVRKAVEASIPAIQKYQVTDKESKEQE